MNQEVTSSKFGIMSYYRMLKYKGFSYAYGYFLNNHLWDIRNKTDTHKRLMKEDYSEHDLSSFESANHYGVSWNSEIKKSFQMANQYLKNMNDFLFMDVGCGKGKVLILWRKYLSKYGVQQDIVGIEYSHVLAKIALENYEKVIGDQATIEIADVTSMDFEKYGKNLIIYLYNPFVGDVFTAFMNKLSNHNVFLVYNNPSCHQQVMDAGFSEVEEFIICTRETKVYTNFKL